MEIKEFLNGLNEGESFVIPGRGGWTYTLTKTANGFDIEVKNQPEPNWEKFFTATTKFNPYGALEVVQEVSLGIDFTTIGITGVGKPLKDRLIGELVMDEAGKIKERFSPSNYKQQGKVIRLDGRQMLIDGTPKGYLNAVFEADKNRIHGHVGIFQPKQKGDVKVLEMESLMEAALR